MLADNRLDAIKNISDDYLAMMENLRKDFIALDTRLRILGGLDDFKKEGAARCIALARTNLEHASMCTNKAICLMGENKQ